MTVVKSLLGGETIIFTAGDLFDMSQKSTLGKAKIKTRMKFFQLVIRPKEQKQTKKETTKKISKFEDIVQKENKRFNNIGKLSNKKL